MPTIEQVLALADAIDKYRDYSKYESLRRSHAVTLAEAWIGCGIFVNEELRHAYERFVQWGSFKVETDDERIYLSQLKEIAADRFATLLMAYLRRDRVIESAPPEEIDLVDRGGAYDSEAPAAPPSSTPATPSDGELPL